MYPIQEIIMNTETQRKWWLAGLFSYLVPGLGQVYNGQLVKGLLMHIGLTLWGGVLFGILFPLLHQPVTPAIVLRFFVLLIISVLLHWAIIIEAIRKAWKRRKSSFAPQAYNRWFVYLIVIALFSLINVIETHAIRTCVIRPFRIPTASMESTLRAGDMLISNLLYFSTHNPERGDVVIFHPPNQPNAYFIKRIIGLPGDSIEIRGSDVLINGNVVDEPYVLSGSDHPLRDNFEAVQIPMQHYFVLGDNRNNSRDSRDFGPIPRNQIVGKPMFVYFSSVHGRTLFHRLFAIRFGRIGRIIR